MITLRHFANFAPASPYLCTRSGNVSSPLESFSLGKPGRSTSPSSSLMPGMMPFSAQYSRKGLPSSVFCQNVSSKKITPERMSFASRVVSRSWRYCLRFSSVCSTPTAAKRLFAVPADSSAASIPFPEATRAWAVVSSNCVSIIKKYNTGRTRFDIDSSYKVEP